ncbi:MAG: ABC transporter ATP-binding protein [Firmicutes bacterium]|nr:ABC transporter ATP-binding protein [[Eubacterium] siraeum]MCM1488433.1 ABC transporter ATP-binding protein [Bacillota bacterium]
MNAIEIKDLTKSYKDFKLDGLTFALPEGCILGLIGENGAGKSTTVRLILNMIRKDGGSVKILGRENTENISDIKEDIGVVTDEAGIPECLNAKEVGRIMKNTFKNWDGAYYDRLLEKLELPRSKKFKDLSRGMKMKLAIAAAMAHDPKLLILDEATSGLDPVARDTVAEMLYDFTREENHSVLISSHIVSDLERLCDYVAFLCKGKLILFEEKDRLAEEYGIVRCTEAQLSGFSSDAVIHSKITPYGAEALVKRNKIPSSVQVGSVSIEELFVQMAKEAV